MALTEERKKQLTQLVVGAIQKQSPTTGDILQKTGGPFTPGVVSKAAGEAIRQGTPEFGQEQAERERSRVGILPRGELGGIKQAPIEQFEEVPTGISPEGRIEKKIERTPEAGLELKRQEAEITADKEVRAKKLKDVQTTRQDLTNASLKIDNTFQSWLDAVSRTEEITGLPPGPLGGAFTTVLGATKANEFVNAFTGGLTEYAAAVGRIAIPGARAVRLVNLFKETAPGKFDSVASAIEQTALSYKNGLATAISRDPETFFPELAGKVLGREEFDFIRDKLNEFQETYRQGLFEIAFKKNPNLLPPDKRVELEKKFGVLDQEERNVFNILEEEGG